MSEEHSYQFNVFSVRNGNELKPLFKSKTSFICVLAVELACQFAKCQFMSEMIFGANAMADETKRQIEVM